jgi:8-oxo-dGTP pyrophosphatase MutT (NUDIX family)
MTRRGEPKRRGAVAVIVRQGRLLVIRRSRLVVAPLRYCFPGGAIEPGESEQEALVREIREELNVEILPQRRLWQSVTPWRVDLAWWLGQLPAGAEPVPAPAEVESVHWYTPAEMAALDGLLESNQAFLEALSAGEIELDL